MYVKCRGFNESALKCCTSEGSNFSNDILHPDCTPIGIPTDDKFYSR